ncbi:MAG: P22 phage major capsid protein family protein [Fluviibacter sp.]
MANALITSTLITNEVLRVAHNTSAFLGRMNTTYEKEWKGKYAPGATVYARRPVQYTIRNGATANVQDLTESSVAITVQPELGIDFAVSDFDLTMAVRNDGSIDKAFRERYLVPAGKRIAAEVDYQVGALIKNSVANFVGTPGTGPSTLQHLADAQVPMDNEACPRDDMRYAALSPIANAALVPTLATLFNSRDRIESQYKSGVLNPVLGFEPIMSQNVPTHTVGALGGTPLVNGANQGLTNSGATDNPYGATTSLVTDGWTAAAANRLKKGDVITIAGVTAVNPETKQSTGALRQFVVTADVSSDGSGNATVIISPAIIAGGAFQNVTARPADNAAITVVSGSASTAYVQNLFWHKDAIAFVSPEMDLPGGMEMASQATMADEGGISLRFVRGYDILNNRRISRFDVLWGAGVLKPEWCVRRTA